MPGLRSFLNTERLDDRLNPASCFWTYTGTGYGDATLAANWGGNLPGAGDTAVIIGSLGNMDATGLSDTISFRFDVAGSIKVKVDKLEIIELDTTSTSALEFEVSDELTLRLTDTSNAYNVTFSPDGTTTGKVSIKGTATSSTFTNCTYSVPVDVMAAEFHIAGTSNTINNHSITVKKSGPYSNAANLYLDPGAKILDGAGSPYVYVNDGGNIIVTGTPGNAMCQIDPVLSVLALGSVEINQSQSANAGLKLTQEAFINGTTYLYGGNTLVADGGYTQSNGSFYIKAKATGGTYHKAAVTGDMVFTNTQIRFEDHTSDYVDLDVAGDVSLAGGNSVTMYYDWADGKMNVWDMGATGTLNFSNSNSLTWYDKNRPSTPPTTTGEFLPIKADDITGNFTSCFFYQGHNYGNDIVTITGGEAVRIYWNGTLWPVNHE